MLGLCGGKEQIMVYIIYLDQFNFNSCTKDCIQKYILLFRIFTIWESYFPFPTPVCLFGKSCSCWWYCLLAVISTIYHQLCDINPIFIQLLQHLQPCPCVRTTATECHISNHCKQIIGGCKHLIFLDVWLNCDCWKVLMFSASPHLLQVLHSQMYFSVLLSTHIGIQY